MNTFSEPCRARRERLALLAAGLIETPERRGLEAHLAECAGCWDYHNNLAAVATTLVRSKEVFARLEPTEGMKTRWQRAVRAAGPDAPARRPASENLWHGIWRELIWPCRTAWMGMAALWVIMACVNFGSHGRDGAITMASASKTSDDLRAWAEQNRELAELIHSEEPAVSVPSQRPRPRSERQLNSKVV